MNAPREAPHKWVVAGTVLLGTIMAVLDSSVVNVALPPMRGTFGATVEEITWVVTGYILATVIMTPPPAPWMARKKIISGIVRARPHAMDASVKSTTLAR